MKEVLLKDNKICILDEDDFENLKKYKLNLSTSNYVKLYYKGRYTFLHRLLLNVVDTKIKVDHINRNPLDNRKINLRLATNSQNGANRISLRGTSKYKGVCRFRGIWRAYISCLEFRCYHLGIFNSEYEAAKAYDSAAKYFWDDFALLNFPNESTEIFILRNKKTKTSNYKGVAFDRERNKWKAYINMNNKQVWIARFNSENEAYLARQNKLKELKENP